MMGFDPRVRVEGLWEITGLNVSRYSPCLKQMTGLYKYKLTNLPSQARSQPIQFHFMCLSVVFWLFNVLHSRLPFPFTYFRAENYAYKPLYCLCSRKCSYIIQKQVLFNSFINFLSCVNHINAEIDNMLSKADV